MSQNGGVGHSNRTIGVIGLSESDLRRLHKIIVDNRKYMRKRWNLGGLLTEKDCDITALMGFSFDAMLLNVDSDLGRRSWYAVKAAGITEAMISMSSGDTSTHAGHTINSGTDYEDLLVEILNSLN